MLLACPECGKQVSDRAAACPGCGFPIAEHVAQQQADADAEADRTSREVVGEADCPHCQARGFADVTLLDEHGNEKTGFSWCTACEHSGRSPLVRSSRGYWVVAYAFVDEFVGGADPKENASVFLGTDPPSAHKYTKAGKRYADD